MPEIMLSVILVTTLLYQDVCGAEVALCNREGMDRCTRPLRVLTDNRDLGFAATERELARMCPTLMEGMNCINNFTTDCLKPHHRVYFNTLYDGTKRVINDLCSEGGYQEEYLLHAPCMRSVQRGYEVCADEYHTKTERISPSSPSGDASGSAEQIRLLCCSFKSYLHCSQQVVLHRCGLGTANFTKSFLERMAGPLVQTHCEAYSHGSEMCSGCHRLQSISTSLLSLVSALLFVTHLRCHI